MNRTRLVVAIISAFTSAALLIGGALLVEVVTGSASHDSGSAFSAELPNFDLPSVHGDGQRYSTAGFVGKPFVVNIFDYTCVPCIRELPMLDKTAAANPDVGFVGVHLLLKRADAAKFVERLGVRFPVVHDADGVFASAALGLPTTIFVSPEGREMGRVTGAIAEADLKDRLQRLREGIS